MKKSFSLFIATITFPALEIATYADRPADENGTPFKNRSSGGHRYDLNVPAEQGRLTEWPEWGEVSL
jgi:hypothetical protein